MNSLPFQFFQLYNAYTLLIMAMESNFREWQVRSSYPTFRFRGMRFDPAKSSSLIYVITVFRLDVTFFVCSGCFSLLHPAPVLQDWPLQRVFWIWHKVALGTSVCPTPTPTPILQEWWLWWWMKLWLNLSTEWWLWWWIKLWWYLFFRCVPWLSFTSSSSSATSSPRSKSSGKSWKPMGSSTSSKNTSSKTTPTQRHCEEAAPHPLQPPTPRPGVLISWLRSWARSAYKLWLDCFSCLLVCWLPVFGTCFGLIILRFVFVFSC